MLGDPALPDVRRMTPAAEPLEDEGRSEETGKGTKELGQGQRRKSKEGLRRRKQWCPGATL